MKHRHVPPEKKKQTSKTNKQTKNHSANPLHNVSHLKNSRISQLRSNCNDLRWSKWITIRDQEQSSTRFKGRDFGFWTFAKGQIFPAMGRRSYKCLCGIKRDLEMNCNPVPQIWNCVWLAWAFQENPLIHCPNLIQIIRFWIKVGYSHQNQNR